MFFGLESGLVRRVETEADATLTRVELEGDEPVRREMQIRETSRYILVNP
jgi:hypothetical protein